MSPNQYNDMALGNDALWKEFPSKANLATMSKEEKKETLKEVPSTLVPNDVKNKVYAFVQQKKELGWEARRIRRAVEREFGIEVLQ